MKEHQELPGMTIIVTESDSATAEVVSHRNKLELEVMSKVKSKVDVTFLLHWSISSPSVVTCDVTTSSYCPVVTSRSDLARKTRPVLSTVPRHVHLET